MKKIEIVLLAAGAGKRFGGGKLEALVDGKPMYMHALEGIEKQMLPAHPMVVTGNPVIADTAQKKHMDVVFNYEPELGISHSICLALQYLIDEKREFDAVLFMVCDQPWLKSETLADMLQYYESGILAVRCGSRKGNPVIFSKDYLDELQGLSGDVGGRQVMAKHQKDVVYFEVSDEKELRDIDRKEQL